MNHPAPICPKCQQAMQAGFLLDRTHGANMQSGWIEGEAHTGKILGMSTGVLDNSIKHLHPVTCYRCPGCSYLESYAYPLSEAEAESMLLRAAQGAQQTDSQQLLRGSTSPEPPTND